MRSSCGETPSAPSMRSSVGLADACPGSTLPPLRVDLGRLPAGIKGCGRSALLRKDPTCHAVVPSLLAAGAAVALPLAHTTRRRGDHAR